MLKKRDDGYPDDFPRNKRGTPLTRASNTMTEAAFQGFIRTRLRRMAQGWKPINDAKKAARTRRGFYRCAICHEEVPASRIATEGRKKGKRVTNVVIDHLIPVVDPVTGFESWDRFIESLLCEVENLQAVCYRCHKSKTAEERAERDMHRRLKP